jgi:hypothetical protein
MTPRFWGSIATIACLLVASPAWAQRAPPDLLTVEKYNRALEEPMTQKELYKYYCGTGKHKRPCKEWLDPLGPPLETKALRDQSAGKAFLWNEEYERVCGRREHKRPCKAWGPHITP